MVAKRKTRAASQPLRTRRPGVLGRDLAFLWTAAHHRQEALTGAIAEVHNAAPIGSPWGLAADCSTGQRNVEWLLQPITTSNGSGTGDYTMLVVANPSASGTVGHVFAQKNDSAGSPFAQAALLANSNAAASASSGSFAFFAFNGGSYGAAASGVIDGDYHVWIGVRRGTVYELYKDGALIAATGGVAVNINQANRYTAVGSRGNGTTEAFAENVLAAAAWNTALLAEEIAGLGTPDKVLRLFGVRRIFVPVSAGGGGSHDATGAMSAQSATVSGSAAAVATYTSSGALTAQAATVAGTANHVTTHASSGVLEAQAATVAGSATHVAVHGSTGVLEAQAATVSGSADHSAAGAFSATGALTAQVATVAGSAAHLTLHTATGALVADSATAAGSAVHYTLHTAAGDLVADAASISGSALHEGDGAEVAKPFTGAGRPRRTRQRVVVEIDGEDFIAESVEEARALLDKAKDAAEEKASIAVKRATEAKKRPARKIVADARKSLALPTINAPGLEDYAGQIAQQIEDLYRSTIRTIEVESLLHNRDRAEEDDEDILLLIA